MEDVYIAGRNPILEALKANRKIRKIYIAKGNMKGSIRKIIGIASEKNIIIQEVDHGKLNSMSEGNVHQGVVALVSSFEYSTIEDIVNRAKGRNESPLIIILDEIEDPQNMGAIIRSAECAGAHGVIIPKRRSAKVNQTVYKSSAGAVEHIMVSEVVNISDTIEKLKKIGFWIYGADADGENYYFDTDLKGSTALVIGNEGKGISRPVKERCDALIKIPLLGKTSSLNASASAAILIYDVVRQNHDKSKS